MNEEFKLFKESDRVNYFVSNFGNVKSVNRKSLKERTLILTARITCKTDKVGYKAIGVIINGKMKNFYVHRLVAMLFMNTSIDGMKMINHINGNKHDNNIKNLEWSNHKENALHAYRLGLIKKADIKGSKNPNFGNTRYEKSLIIEAIKMLDGGLKGKAVTRLTGIDTKNLSRYKKMRHLYV